MTKARSEIGDNNGLCKSCNAPATLYEQQATRRILLGWGLGWGTLWVCLKCQKRIDARFAVTGKYPGEGPL